MDTFKRDLFLCAGLMCSACALTTFYLVGAASLLEEITLRTRLTSASSFGIPAVICCYLAWREHVTERLGRTEELIREQSTPAPPPLQPRTATVVQLDMYRQQATHNSRL